MSDFAKSLDQFKYSEENTQGKDASDIKRISTSIYRPPSITSLDITELSPEQRQAYTQFIKGENLFITGPGGTGKTRLVKHLIAYAKSINMNMPVCAMTGCAAVLLECNARTLHSWSGIKLAKQTKADVISSVLKNKSVVKTWKAAQGLILDEVSMLSKKIFEITSQMNTFGDDINIKCSDEGIDLISNGVMGEMLVNIHIDDLSEYSINEGDDINLNYSLVYIHKMCITNKLSNEIQFCVSKEYPMKLKYDLGDNSSIEFYIAPKTTS